MFLQTPVKSGQKGLRGTSRAFGDTRIPTIFFGRGFLWIYEEPVENSCLVPLLIIYLSRCVWNKEKKWNVKKKYNWSVWSGPGQQECKLALSKQWLQQKDKQVKKNKNGRKASKAEEALKLDAEECMCVIGNNRKRKEKKRSERQDIIWRKKRERQR